MNSIRLRLLKWLLGPILLMNVAVGTLAYLLAWSPAQLAFDQSLLDATGALAARLRGNEGAVLLDLPPQAEQVLRADHDDAVYFAVRDAGGGLLAGDADFPSMLRTPGQAVDGAMRGEPIRLASIAIDVGGQLVRIGVGKTLRKRTQLRAATLRALVLLETVFTLSLVGLIWFSVTNGLQPLARLRARLDARDGDDLAPLNANLPLELAPLVAAFNNLLAKLQASTRAQHDFLANVAHQLRTPLAGMKLQLEWVAQRHAGDQGTVHSAGLMLQSNERMIRQVNQLLALARAEPSRFEKERLAPLDLAAVVADSVQFFVEQAAKKDIDLGFELAPAPVLGDPFLLRDLIDNLVDNALRYTPSHGQVTISCEKGEKGSVLRVEDSGPGIALAKRELVFHRFVRLDEKTTGSGLGLAIVRDIAIAHGAWVGVEGRAQGSGAVFTVHFPG